MPGTAVPPPVVNGTETLLALPALRLIVTLRLPAPSLTLNVLALSISLPPSSLSLMYTVAVEGAPSVAPLVGLARLNRKYSWPSASVSSNSWIGTFRLVSVPTNVSVPVSPVATV